MAWLKEHWPKAYHVLRFRTTNVNTASHWDAAWARHGQDGFRASAELSAVRREILRRMAPGCAVLDVGCGVGELLTELHREKGCRCYGLDISPVAVAKIHALGFEGVVSTLPAIPYPAEMFDAVVSTETLEHVSAARETVEAMHRVLRSGGRLFLSVPDGRTDREEVHVHRFTEQSLTKLLGPWFRVESVECVPEGKEQTLLAVAVKP
jgi:2-polyprenyl-3-methyl-5-hydroxy-6-metoxy-1,4-benzoquinol methylase